MLAAGIVALTGSAAHAHANLVSTDPANGARLDAPPAEIRLQFTERVSVPGGGVELRGPDGAVVETGPAATAEDPSQVVLPVPADLPQGSYLVTFRLVSADSHPVAGAFVFGIGVAPEPLADIDLDDTDPVLSAVFTASRWASYAGLALLAGSFSVFALCWPGGWANGRARRVVTIGWFASLAGAVAVLLLEGPYTAGRPVTAATDPELLAATMDTDYGRYVLARLALVVVAGLLLVAGPAWRPNVRRAAATGIGVALPVTWVGTGHANAAGNPVDMLAAVAHLVAMSAWFGGLALLATCLLPRSATLPVTEVAGVLRRFSLLATGAVATLVTTGVFIAWRQVGALDALFGTPYGRLLAFKLATIGVLLWFGAMSRSVVQRRYAHLDTEAAEPATELAPSRASRSRRRAAQSAHEQEQRSRGQLRQSVRLEVGTAVAVLAVASALVATPPGAVVTTAQAAAERPAPVSVREMIGLGDGNAVEVYIFPAQVGENLVSLTVLDRDGVPLDVPELRASLALPDQDLGPLPVELEATAPGVYESQGTALPVGGTWRLDVTVRTSEIDSSTVSVDVPVA
jgi:copper transport protein